MDEAASRVSIKHVPNMSLKPGLEMPWVCSVAGSLSCSAQQKGCGGGFCFSRGLGGHYPALGAVPEWSAWLLGKPWPGGARVACPALGTTCLHSACTLKYLKVLAIKL